MGLGAEAEQKLRDEIKKLLEKIEEMKKQHKMEFEANEQRLNKIKDAELAKQKEKYDKMIEDLKKQYSQEKSLLENQYLKQIKQLEEDLKVARSGFDAERAALEKKRAEMQDKYEKQLAELQQITKAEFEQLQRDHKAEVSGLKT